MVRQKKEPPSPEEEMVPMKVRRKTLRLLKKLAALRDCLMADYVAEMVIEAARRDLPGAVESLQRDYEGLAPPRPPPGENGKPRLRQGKTSS